MRTHPNKQLKFPDYDKLKARQKMQMAHRVNPDADVRMVMVSQKQCTPIGERGITLATLPPESTVPNIIEQQHWGHFIRTPPMYDEALVREFYANMIPGVYHDQSVVMVQGRQVRINIDDIDAYHQVPRRPDLDDSYGLVRHPTFSERLSRTIAGTLRRTGDQGWKRTTNELLKSDLHTDIAFMMLFIKSSLTPSNHNTTADPYVAQILFSLHENLPMDVGRLIWREILDAGMSVDGALPFPCLITYFCQEAGCEIGQLKVSKKDFNLTHYREQIRAAEKLDRRLGRLPPQEEQNQGAQAEEMEYQYQAQEQPAGNQQMGDIPPWATQMMNTMTQGFEGLHLRMEDFDHRLDLANIPQIPEGQRRYQSDRRRGADGSSSSHQ